MSLQLITGEKDDGPQSDEPDGMYTPNKGIYSQVVTSTGTTTVHIAGTVPFDEDANVVGVGDMKAQTCQILDNLRVYRSGWRHRLPT